MGIDRVGVGRLRIGGRSRSPGLSRTRPSGGWRQPQLYALDAWTDEFLTHLRSLSADLSSDELTDLDRVVERKLYDLDRQEIHDHTDGSDDGFLYCRGFIVAAGQKFYQTVAADPAMAVLDAECEAMCYFFAHLHNARFVRYPDTGSNISRESGRNPDGW